jgi:hypothetical protein
VLEVDLRLSMAAVDAHVARKSGGADPKQAVIRNIYEDIQEIFVGISCVEAPRG